MFGLALLSAFVSTADLVTFKFRANKHPPLATSPHPPGPSASSFHCPKRSFNTREDGREKTYRSCQKHASLSLSTGRHVPDVSFITSLKSHLRTALTTQNTRENNCTTHRHKKRPQFSRCICNWNTSVTGHKQGTVGFSQCKHLRRSTENSEVSISSCYVVVHAVSIRVM